LLLKRERKYSEVRNTYAVLFELFLAFLGLVELLHLVSLLSDKLLLDSTCLPVVQLRNDSVRKYLRVSQVKMPTLSSEDSFVLLGHLCYHLRQCA
jgi:hypothetical protein